MSKFVEVLNGVLENDGSHVLNRNLIIDCCIKDVPPYSSSYLVPQTVNILIPPGLFPKSFKAVGCVTTAERLNPVDIDDVTYTNKQFTFVANTNKVSVDVQGRITGTQNFDLYVDVRFYPCDEEVEPVSVYPFVAGAVSNGGSSSEQQHSVALSPPLFVRIEDGKTLSIIYSPPLYNVDSYSEFNETDGALQFSSINNSTGKFTRLGNKSVHCTINSDEGGTEITFTGDFSEYANSYVDEVPLMWQYDMEGISIDGPNLLCILPFESEISDG